MSRRSIAVFNEQSRHEKVVLVMRRSAVTGSLVSQQAKVVYSSYNAELQIKAWWSRAPFLQGCFLEVWVTLETEGSSLQEGCSESLAVLQKRHFAMHQVVGTSTGWDQCNLEYQVAC